VLAKNDYQILPAQKAFHPQLTVEDDHIKVHFTIAPIIICTAIKLQLPLSQIDYSTLPDSYSKVSKSMTNFLANN